MNGCSAWIVAIVVSLAIGFWLGGYHIVHKRTPEQQFGCKWSEVTPSGECP